MTEMEIIELCKTAKKIVYNPATDELLADGVVVGGADALTREAMLARLTDPSAHSGDSDETLFDLIVEVA